MKVSRGGGDKSLAGKRGLSRETHDGSSLTVRGEGSWFKVPTLADSRGSCIPENDRHSSGQSFALRIFELRRAVEVSTFTL